LFDHPLRHAAPRHDLKFIVFDPAFFVKDDPGKCSESAPAPDRQCRHSIDTAHDYP
jgi:hypothetical protein